MSFVLNYIKIIPGDTAISWSEVRAFRATHQQAIAHTEKQQEIQAEKVRIIKKGGGRKVKLSIEEQILLTLIYLRHLTTNY